MTSKQQDLHLSYVLHSRPYRETSLLLELFSIEYGRVAAVAKGAKRGKAKTSNILQPFIPLSVSWYGNGDLVTLSSAELIAGAAPLQGRAAICGLYVNELLIRLLPKWDHCADLFSAYQRSITNLATGNCNPQVVLRKFELQLLKSMGYALQLEHDVDTGKRIDPLGFYLFDPILGPKLAQAANIAAFSGSSLLALAVGNFEQPGILADTKRLMRLVLRHHLAGRQIVSRELL